MRKLPAIRELIPPWAMPSDPVKAVWWFMQWLLKVLVNFFWIPILAMVIYETVANWMFDGAVNGLVSGLTTLFVGLIVWGVLYAVLWIVNVTTRVSQVISDVNRFQQSFTNSRVEDTWGERQSNPRVVEGTIIDIEEKRRERR